MTDQPTREPIPAHPERDSRADRTADDLLEGDAADTPTTRPSAAEGDRDDLGG